MNDERKQMLEQLKQERLKKKAERDKHVKEELEKRNKIKEAKREDKKNNKQFFKESKIKIKEIKNEKKNALNELKSKVTNQEEYKKQRADTRDEFNEKIIIVKNEIIDRKFEFGKKYKTLNWRLLKWSHGVRKEFNRIIWSSPINTFKYLAIIVSLILFFSGIFIGIDAIVNTFIRK